MQNIRGKLQELKEQGWTIDELIELSNQILEEEKNILEQEKNIPESAEQENSDLIIVSELLKKMGVAVHIKGYGYLRESIVLCTNKPETINCITKKLYPGIAEKFNTSGSKVERAIRHAIERLWMKNHNSEFIKEVFGYSPEDGNRIKPTNSEFIATIVEYLKFK